MLLNLSNHPSPAWDEAQLEAARELYERVVDMDFPSIAPEAGHDEVACLADEYAGRIATLSTPPSVVHVMGEMTFTYAVVSRLKALGIVCVASTTERIVVEADGKRTYTFRFARFREY